MKHNNASFEESSVAILSCTKNDFGSSIVHQQPIMAIIKSHGKYVDTDHFKSEKGEEEKVFIKVKDMDFETNKFTGDFKFHGDVKKSISGKVDFENLTISFSVMGHHKEPVTNGHIVESE